MAAARPNVRAPRLSATVQDRYNHLETQVAEVATTLDGFIKESAEYRTRAERDQSMLWDAIREQGNNLGKAVEKLSTKGQISFAAIATSIGLMLSVSSAVGVVGHMLMESRIRQLEITDQYNVKATDRDHESLLRLESSLQAFTHTAR